MLAELRQLVERFWAWLGGEVPGAEANAAVEPGPDQVVYVVQPGDTLRDIARRFSTSVWVLADLNDLDTIDRIRTGQRLLISRSAVPESAVSPAREPERRVHEEPEAGPVAYIFQTGDTLSALARRFGVTPEAILKANQLPDPDQIRPGWRLLIPRPEPASRQPVLSPPPKLPDPALPPIPWADDAIRGIYVSYSAIGDQAQRTRLSDILTNTEVNALVIDVKGDQGLISYPTDVALAQAIGAAQPSASDFDELMDFFKAKRVYTVARLVTFKDHPLASAHPEWAVRREEGGLWHDREGSAWADPFEQTVWEYNADLAEEVARRGFDEIQFDYLRFPRQSPEGAPHFSQPVSRQIRVAAITGFLSYVRGRLAPLGVRVGAVVFGYTCWRRDDWLVGQEIERMAPYLDVLSPMLYPSAFGSGIPGYPFAIAYPYEIVGESVKRSVERVASWGCQVRPWIQDFPDFCFDQRVYRPLEIRAQMQGSFDGGGTGYLAWAPQVQYTSGAYLPAASP